MKQDQFSERYFIKIGSSVIIAFLNIIIQLILPRALSVKEFGLYSYYLNVYTSVVVMANLSTSNAMVSKYSKRNEEIGIIIFYLKLFLFISVILNVTILCFYKFTEGKIIWLAILGLNSAIINKLLTDAISMYDAIAVAKFPAILNIVLKILLSVCVLFGYFTGVFDLLIFYTLQIIISVLVVTILLCILFYHQYDRKEGVKIHPVKYYIKEYFTFCKPLVMANIIAQVLVIVMNKALMNWSGVVEQAMFGAAWQINTLVGYVFSPYAELMKREFAVLSGEREKIAKRFHQALQHMFWLTSYFAIFILVDAKWILPLVFGNKYQNAVVVTQIIMLYTIYQAWGQITGSFFLAVEITKINARISIISQILTLICVFLFQIPNPIWPHSLGSLGIALNYLLVNIIGVMISVAYVARYLQVDIIEEILIQFPPLLICFIASSTAKIIVILLGIQDSILHLGIKIVMSGMIYTVIVAWILWIRPNYIGFTKYELKEKVYCLLRKRKL